MNGSVKPNSLRRVSQSWKQTINPTRSSSCALTASLRSIADVDSSSASRSNASAPTVPLHLVLMLAGPVSVCIEPAVTKQEPLRLCLSEEGRGTRQLVRREAKLAKGFVLPLLRCCSRPPRLRPGAVSPEREPSSLSTTTKARPWFLAATGSALFRVDRGALHSWTITSRLYTSHPYSFPPETSVVGLRYNNKTPRFIE